MPHMADERHERDKRPTVPICVTCGAEAIHGGPIVPERDFISSVGQCSFGPGWSWCQASQVYRVD